MIALHLQLPRSPQKSTYFMVRFKREFFPTFSDSRWHSNIFGNDIDGAALFPLPVMQYHCSTEI